MAQPVRINLREIPLKTAIHTLYAASLREPIVLSPALVASDKRVTLDVTLQATALREFSDAFIARQGVEFVKRGGALMFDFQTGKLEPDDKKADSPPESTVDSRSLRDQLNISPDCWVSNWQPPQFAIQCVDGNYFTSEEVSSLRPKLSDRTAAVTIKGVTYRMRTPPAFYARLTKSNQTADAVQSDVPARTLAINTK